MMCQVFCSDLELLPANILLLCSGLASVVGPVELSSLSLLELVTESQIRLIVSLFDILFVLKSVFLLSY